MPPLGCNKVYVYVEIYVTLIMIKKHTALVSWQLPMPRNEWTVQPVFKNFYEHPVVLVN